MFDGGNVYLARTETRRKETVQTGKAETNSQTFRVRHVLLYLQLIQAPRVPTITAWMSLLG
jgi:hypothetical protein